MVVRYGGSISAEHGIGIAKLDFVTSARSAGDLAVMRKVKAALDPDGILNPGVLLPPGVTCDSPRNQYRPRSVAGADGCSSAR